MEITYFGGSCVRLRGRDVQVVLDPPARLTGAVAKPVPDVVVRTSGKTQPDLLRAHSERPQEISGPGEFELRGVAVQGVPAGPVTLMCVEVDDVRVVSLGGIDRELTESEIDDLGHVDVLIIPVGGGDVLSSAAAARVVNLLEPGVVIPVRFRSDLLGGAGYEPVETFAKEMGLTDPGAAQPKLVVSGSTAASEETRVVVLEPRN